MFNRESKKDRRSGKNKGFSLVELIVVIAIMAVLVAVLAPQFTKYIDRSRKSNDAATVAGIVTAAQVGIADTSYAVPEDVYTITLTKTATTVAGAATGNTDATSLTTAITDTCGALADLKITSENWEGDTVVITLTYQNGAVTVEYSDDFEAYVNGATEEAGGEEQQ